VDSPTAVLAQFAVLRRAPRPADALPGGTLGRLPIGAYAHDAARRVGDIVVVPTAAGLESPKGQFVPARDNVVVAGLPDVRPGRPIEYSVRNRARAAVRRHRADRRRRGRPPRT
jgi:hypothetical protein